MMRILLTGLSAIALLASGPAVAESDILTAEQIAYKLSRSKNITGHAKVDLPTVTFEFDSVELMPQARRQLDELAKALKFPAFRDLPFTVAGHTDAIGTEDYNLDLSERRAQAVKAYLTRNFAFPGEKVRTVGHGERRLKADLPPDADEQRRVEITLAFNG